MLIKELELRYKAAVVKKMLVKGEINEENLALEDIEYFSEIETDSVGSDSSVSDGLPMQLLHQNTQQVVVEASSHVYAWKALLSEAVAQRCSVKNVILEILQNSQESVCTRVAFLTKLQA